MARYQGTPRRDKAKAIAAVVAVHLVLGAIILTGLNVETVGRAIERLKTFDINEEAPPPPVPEPPPPRAEDAAPDEPAPPNLKSQATPVVAPPPAVSLPVPLPITAAERPGQGSDRTTGAASVAGPGTGAGGRGSGTGGGGSGAGDGRSPAVLVRNIPRNDYRSIGGDRLPQGSAELALSIDAQGRVSGCRVERSSGDPVVDGRVCALAQRRLRFRPARDPQGRPIPYYLSYMATWSRR